MNPSIQWAAVLEHVHEVSLRGEADLDFWRDRRRREDLLPAEVDGRAQVLLIAADARFLGIRFQELSFSIQVSGSGAPARPAGAFLVHAFKSGRFFAFCERVFFRTPYSHGDVRLSASLPAAVQLVKEGQAVFQVQMADPRPQGREPSRSGEDGWEGPVYLPGEGRPGPLFHARIRGQTETYPFLAASDSLLIRPAQGCEVLQDLLDSRFVVKEWAIRADATHAKSKTYPRR
jgi:hypothetical protein